ncbi:MAG TPA: metallophosphoesterase family protein [Candidatus Saccharimonadales bacterium]|nr:metallophosphoesterase family protein [Candidatus Saccharimonadales bacterium]
MRIGIISDTHGLLRPEAETALQGTQLIVHAGDVGSPEILMRLKAIAPVFAVRGNVDREAWARELPLTAVVEADSTSFYVLHNIRELDLKPEAAKIDFVISGHTHQAEQTERNGVIYLNPGSAGPKRFHLPVTLAVLDLSLKPWKAQFIPLIR